MPLPEVVENKFEFEFDFSKTKNVFTIIRNARCD